MSLRVVLVIGLLWLGVISLLLDVAEAKVAKKCNCSKIRCPVVSNCPGKMVKDRCGCCTVCNDGPGEQIGPHFQGHRKRNVHRRRNWRERIRIRQPIRVKSNPCNEVTCAKPKVCRLNIQDIPICKCPSSLRCRVKRRHRRRNRALCGSDGITYESRCHMRVAACLSGIKLKVVRKGDCYASKKKDKKVDRKLFRWTAE